MKKAWAWVQNIILGQAKLRAEYERGCKDAYEYGWLEGYSAAKNAEYASKSDRKSNWEYEF